jgi:plasmid stability protein
MATITVKNIPDDVYERLKQSAQANRRSINSEIIVCIERAVSPHVIEPDEWIARARILREKTARYQISDAEFNAAKAAGRE